MAALVRAVVVAPHLSTDLQGLLESLEALTQRGERNAQPVVLPLVPGCANAEHGATFRQDVERGDDLGQETGVPVRNTRYEQTEAHRLGDAGEVAERGVPLEHRVLGRRHPVHLEVVVHDRELADPTLLCRRAVANTAGPMASGPPGTVKFRLWTASSIVTLHSLSFADAQLALAETATHSVGSTGQRASANRRLILSVPTADPITTPTIQAGASSNAGWCPDSPRSVPRSRPCSHPTTSMVWPR